MLHLKRKKGCKVRLYPKETKVFYMKEILKAYSISFSIGSFLIYLIFTLLIGSLNPWGWSETTRCNFAVILSIFMMIHFFSFPAFLNAWEFKRK